MIENQGEFIEREKQFPADTRQAPVSVTDNAALAELKSAPRGDPPAEFSVRAVYDSRPVQGTDFNITVSVSLDVSPQVVIADFEVPDGYVFILRQVWRFWVEPTPIIAERLQVTLSIVKNGAKVPYNQNLFVGEAIDTPLNCFVIGDAGDRLGFAIDVQSGEGASPPGTAFAILYGQQLVKTGVPAVFESTNPIGHSKIASMKLTEPSAHTPPAPEKPLIQPPQPPPPIPATRPVDICRGLNPKTAALMTPQEKAAWTAQWQSMNAADRIRAYGQCGLRPVGTR